MNMNLKIPREPGIGFTEHATRNTFQAFASSGVGSPSSAPASSARAPATLSAGDSTGAVSFCAATNSAVNIPVPSSVFLKNVSVEGQPLIPLVSARIQLANVLTYSAL